MANQTIAKGVQTINELAENIAGSDYWRKIAPGFKQLQSEVMGRVGASLQKDTAAINASDLNEHLKNKASQTITNLLTRNGMEAEAASRLSLDLTRNITSSTYEAEAGAIASKLSGKIGNISTDDFSSRLKNLLGKEIGSDAFKQQVPQNAEEVFKNFSMPKKGMEYAKAYFSNSDKDVHNARVQTAVGAYAALTVGGRYLSGGTLTRDQYGRNDIAGIPFI